VGVGNADQRSKIGTINISPTYTRVVNNYAVLNVGAFVRRDEYNYYPSANPLPAVCLASEFGSSLVKIPAPGTGDNDHNPQRI
jgi:hypothetical protein